MFDKRPNGAVLLIAALAVYASALESTILAGSTANPMAATGDFERLKEYFRWAEYDSVLTIAPVLADDPTLSLRDRANVHQCLGVAWFESGSVIESASEFLEARRLDSTLILDPLFVTTEVVDHYRFTLASESYLPIHAAAELEFQSRARAEVADKLRVFALSGALVGTIGSLAGVYEYQRAERAFKGLKAAAKKGDQSAYLDLKEKVKVGDRRALGAASMALGGFVASALLWLEWSRIRNNEPSKKGFAGADWHIGPYGTAIACAF